MPLRACMRAHTHREYLLWMVHLQEENNQPSRSDHYLMSIAQEVESIPSRLTSKKPRRMPLSKFVLSFRRKMAGQEKKPKLTKKEVTERAKRRWSGFLGIGRK